MKRNIICLLYLFICLTLSAQVEPLLLYKAQHDKQCNQWVSAQMSKMTLEEKVGQLFIYTLEPEQSAANIKLLKKVVKGYKIGGILFSGGTVAGQAAVTNAAQKMTNIPIMIMVDGEWGLAMRLHGTPCFPKNMTLGCIQDDRLIYEYGREMARQCRLMGIQCNFAPDADVNINPKNPVINSRSFGEQPIRVADKVIAYASGLERGGVLSVCKHFPGHGDTNVDSHKALPVLPFSRERLDSIELYPFKEAIHAGLSGVMVGHLQVPVFDPVGGLPSSLSRNVVYSLLTEELKFKGLIFTDALAMKGVSGESNVCLQALMAGNDMVLAPADLKDEIESVMQGISEGKLKTEDIENKCRKVLTYKYILGLSRKPTINANGLLSRLNTPDTRDLIRRLNLAAITVIDNKDKLLPLTPDINEMALLQVGQPEDLETFTSEMDRFTSMKTFRLRPYLKDDEQLALRDSLAQYKRIVVAVSETRLTSYQSFFNKFAPKVPVVYVFFTAAKLMLQIQKAVSLSSAVVAAHNPRNDVERETAQILFGKATADGRLSAGIGTLFAAGAGETITPNTPYHYIPEEYGMNSTILKKIDDIANEGLKAEAYPGCQIVVLKDGRSIYDKCFGTHTYSDHFLVRSTDMYDIASLSKTTGTLLALMKLYDRGAFTLDEKVSYFLPYLRNTNKKNITMRDLMFHESGLPSGSTFYFDAIDPKSHAGPLFSNKQDDTHTIQVGKNIWANPNFKFKEGLTSPTSKAGYTTCVTNNLWLSDSFKGTILKKICSLPMGPKRYMYSDIGFILLQQVVEHITGMSLDKYLKRNFFDKMALQHTAYLPLRYYRENEVIPSSVDAFLRKGELKGYVNDEAAAFLGCISGNAGLFSSAEEVANIYQMILNGGDLDGQRYLSEETCRLFTTLTSKLSRRGLGYDKPDKKNPSNSPCAAAAPASVYGHTGFTGTCAWVDPENHMVYVFLSNRTYPNAWENKLRDLKIRERIQAVLYQAIVKTKVEKQTSTPIKTAVPMQPKLIDLHRNK
jgi:beta-glucosidase-like glycosyl hydrolase/CubicO group peptidase (beta-lactamase class C family)